MKKIILLMITIILFVTISYSQKGIFYLAKFLREQYSVDTKKILFDATIKAALEKDVYKKINVDTAVLNANPFFKDLFEPAPGAGILEFIIPAMTNIGGLDVTKYANAIADIMIERAKEELTVAFFDRFKKFAKDNPEFQILFPKTTDNLSNLLSYTYPQMLPALRNGFFEDLKQVTYHLDDVLDLPRYQTLLKNFSEVKIAIRSIRLVHEIETGASNAADVIKEFAYLKEWDDRSNVKIQNAGNCLKIASLFSESIRNDTSHSHTSDIWIPAEIVKQLFYDEVFFNIYLGLIYQQSINDDIKFVESDGSLKKFAGILASKKNDLFIFQNKLKEFFDLGANVNTAFKNFQTKLNNKEKPSDDDIYNYINTSIDVIEYGYGIVKIFHETPTADDYLAIPKKSNDLYKHVYTKQYSQSVIDALDIFSMLGNLIKSNPQMNFNKLKKDNKASANNDIKKLASHDKKVSRVESNIDNAVKANIADTIAQHLIEHYTLKQLFDFVEKVKPYALFMANMIEAKDDKQVKAALENVILPVGSSSIKKITSCNVSVQSYLGAYWSTSNGSTSSQSAWSDKFGVTAPIGISFTPGFLSWQKGGSLSLFASLIDLGAIVDYKLKKDSTINNAGATTSVVSKNYSVKLGQIFSPGISLVYGFAWNLPLAVGFGGQYGPGLSKIDAGNNIVITNPSWRWNLFLAVDIPFFTLKNKIKSN